MRRVANFSNQYPWQWQLAEYEAFMAWLRSGDRAIRYATARSYESELRLFLEYATDPRLWLAICAERFGESHRSGPVIVAAGQAVSLPVGLTA